MVFGGRKLKSPVFRRRNGISLKIGAQWEQVREREAGVDVDPAWGRVKRENCPKPLGECPRQRRAVPEAEWV